MIHHTVNGKIHQVVSMPFGWLVGVDGAYGNQTHAIVSGTLHRPHRGFAVYTSDDHDFPGVTLYVSEWPEPRGYFAADGTLTADADRACKMPVRNVDFHTTPVAPDTAVGIHCGLHGHEVGVIVADRNTKNSGVLKMANTFLTDRPHFFTVVSHDGLTVAMFCYGSNLLVVLDNPLNS